MPQGGDQEDLFPSRPAGSQPNSPQSSMTSLSHMVEDLQVTPLEFDLGSSAARLTELPALTELYSELVNRQVESPAASSGSGSSIPCDEALQSEDTSARANLLPAWAAKPTDHHRSLSHLHSAIRLHSVSRHASDPARYNVRANNQRAGSQLQGTQSTLPPSVDALEEAGVDVEPDSTSLPPTVPIKTETGEDSNAAQSPTEEPEGASGVNHQVLTAAAAVAVNLLAKPMPLDKTAVLPASMVDIPVNSVSVVRQETGVKSQEHQHEQQHKQHQQHQQQHQHQQHQQHQHQHQHQQHQQQLGQEQSSTEREEAAEVPKVPLVSYQPEPQPQLLPLPQSERQNLLTQPPPPQPIHADQSDQIIPIRSGHERIRIHGRARGVRQLMRSLRNLFQLCAGRGTE